MLQVLVLKVVEMTAAIVGERLRDFRFRLGHDVPPHRPIVERHLALKRLIGIDRVAEMDEHVRFGAPHRIVKREAAVRRIDPPALTDTVR